jgi:hypothetical protein
VTEKKTEGGTIVPDTLPEGFPSVKPHVNEKSYRYTITLRNGNYYPITSDARSVKELFSRIFTPPGTDDTIQKSLLDATTVNSEHGNTLFLHFPEAAIGVGPDKESMIEAIVADWPLDEEEMLDEDEDDDEEDEAPPTRRSGRKPKKPY